MLIEVTTVKELKKKNNMAGIGKYEGEGNFEMDSPGYKPYGMKGNPMYHNYGIGTPPKGVSEESPGKFLGKLFKGAGNVAKKALNVMNPLTGGPIGAGIRAMKGGGEGAGGDLEGRVAALEAESGGGAEVEPAVAEGDPAAAGQEAGAQAAMAATKQKQAMGVGGGMMGNMFSDIRLKEKIEKTGASASGIPIYEFNYIGSNDRYSGAMAQDLLEINPDAVTMDTSGYYKVNYNNIDVDMRLIN